MALDNDDKKTIAELIAAAFAGDAFTKAVGEAAKGAVAALKVDDIVTAKVKDAAKDLKPPDPDPKKGKDGKDFDPGAERLAAVEKQLLEQTKAREAAESARQLDQLHNAAREALVKAGIPADRTRHAMAVLIQDGVLVIDKDGKPGWKGKDKYGTEAVLPIEDGARSWATTEDGKAYLPPTGAAGTGDNVSPARPPVTQDGKIDVASLRGRVGSAILSGAIE